MIIIIFEELGLKIKFKVRVKLFKYLKYPKIGLFLRLIRCRSQNRYLILFLKNCTNDTIIIKIIVQYIKIKKIY